MQLTECAGVIWPSLPYPMGTGARGSGINADTLATAIAVRNKLSFISEPVISCLYPASMKLCSANLLACNQDKNQRPFTVLEDMFQPYQSTHHRKEKTLLSNKSKPKTTGNHTAISCKGKGK